MIGRIAYGVARAGVRGAGAQPARSGPPKQWSPVGKITFVAVLAWIVTAEHWWLPVLCWGGALAVVSCFIVAAAMSGRPPRDREAEKLDQAMSDWDDKP